MEDAISREPSTSHEPHTGEAEIIPFPPQQENLDPATLSDADCIALFVGSWLHPDIDSFRLPETIINDTSAAGDPWEKKLAELIKHSSSMDGYDRYYEDPIFRTLGGYLQQTRARADYYSSERKAVLRLMDLRAYEIDQGRADNDLLYQTFLKMTRQ